MNKKEFVLYLYKIGAIKFGQFKLKSGIISPIYIDLRTTISFPDLMNKMANIIINKIKDKKFDLISGIPYTALPVASIISSKIEAPLIFVRKEEKTYGTKKMIEGNYKKGDTVLIIDDLITTGESKIETADAFKEAGMNVKDIVVFIDRSFNGKEFLKRHNLELSSIISIDEILEILKENNLIEDRIIEEVKAFMQKNTENKKLSYRKRALKAENPTTKKLLNLMETKSSNLCLSLDKDNSKEFFEILNKTADKIVVLKTHIDIISDFSLKFTEKLKDYAKEEGFLILEDRKFADIGNTVRKQYRKGIYKIASWSDLVTVHTIAGPSILDGLFKESNEEKSALLIAKMSSKDNLITDNYTRRTIEIGEKHKRVVTGFIGFGRNENEIKMLRKKMRNDFLLFMPGINLDIQNDNLGQRYVTPEEAVRGGADIIIVGRGIYASKNPKAQAEKYRKAGWNGR